MSNEEFDNLKEELMWEGSSVVMLSNNSSFFHLRILGETFSVCSNFLSFCVFRC